MLPTRATEALGIEHPVVQAGMARGFSDARLVAAVSGAGGLGVLGCLNRSADEVVSEVRRVTSLTDRPFGVNFVVEHLDEDAFAACLAEPIAVYTFFRGEPEHVVRRARATGALTVYQVTTVDEARRALHAGVDMLVAQGSESGGHVGPNPLSRILPAILDVAGSRPVLAAGAIVDGASLASVLRMGADGAWMGTRFLATPESPAPPAHKQAIVEAAEGSTVRSGVWDVIWGRPWPGVQVRAIRNELLDRWVSRQDEIPAARTEINAGIERAEQRGDASEIDLMAGAGVGRILDIRPAGELVRSISAEAERMIGSPDSM